MSKITNCTQIALLALMSFRSYAVVENLSNITDITQLESSLNIDYKYQSCNKFDDYWLEQSGPDFVEISPVNSDAAIIEAKNVTAKQDSTYYASGDVSGYKNDDTFFANWLIYDPKDSHVTGGDNIILTRQYDVLSGSWIDYYLDINQGIVKQGVVYQQKTNMYAEGEQISILNKYSYKVEKGYMTTCDPNDPDWNIRVKEVNFDYQDSQGTARGAIFYAKSVPIAYFPYLQFPLGERRSGVLFPQLGGGSNAGSSYMIPFYWNIAPNYDMTITPKYYSVKGLMIADEFRYLSESGGGNIYTEQLQNDSQTNKYRYYWHLTDDHNFIKDLHTGYDYNIVSDNNYFNDFGNYLTIVNNYNLNQSVYANYTPQWGLLGIKAQQYQTLQPLDQPAATAQIYAVAPQINFNIKPIAIAPTLFKLEMQSQYTNFTGGSGTLQTGQRAVFYPGVTMPLENTWGFIKPKLGYNYTNYQLASFPMIAQNPYAIGRSIPISSIDSGLTFERPINLLSTSYAQTIEPRLYYLYIPRVDQTNIPMFDTAPSSYNLNQLFSENRFSGFDRINMANDITLGTTSRLINDYNGTEVANWGIGYRYYITPEDQFEYGNFNRFPVLLQAQPNLITELGNKWANSLSTNLNFQYSSVFDTIDAYAFQMQYRPEEYKVLNSRFSYQFNQPVLYYAWTPGQNYTPAQYVNMYNIDVSGQWPIYANRWFIEGRANYDLTRSVWINYLGGLEYNGGCWSVHFTYQNYITAVPYVSTKPVYTNAYMFQFTLKGLSSINFGDPVNNSQINIPGYLPLNNIH